MKTYRIIYIKSGEFGYGHSEERIIIKADDLEEAIEKLKDEDSYEGYCSEIISVERIDGRYGYGL